MRRTLKTAAIDSLDAFESTFRKGEDTIRKTFKKIEDRYATLEESDAKLATIPAAMLEEIEDALVSFRKFDALYKERHHLVAISNPAAAKELEILLREVMQLRTLYKNAKGGTMTKEMGKKLLAQLDEVLRQYDKTEKKLT